MRKNYSPWIHQLNRIREEKKITQNENTNICIVGAGIAGVMTSYFILKNTNKKIILIDADKAGHGASGHNAGQLTTYFERPLADIATEFGVDMACSGQKDVESAWLLLEQIKNETTLKTPIYTFTGYAGMSELKQILLHLADNMIRYDGGINIETMYIADNFSHLKDIPSIYSHLFEVTTHENILSLLETDNKDYVAALAYKKGVTNSAKICEELICYMLENYNDRFTIFENSPVEKIILNENHTNISIDKNYNIVADKIVLCTNGFEGFHIENKSGEDVDNSFHKNINGRINFMSAYLDTSMEDPVAISYFPKEEKVNADKNTVTGEQYFYMTRRPHTHDGEEMSLISTGGPERILDEDYVYKRNSYCEPWAEEAIDNFLKNNYKKHKGEKVTYDFCWHGLLGYTLSGIRLVGEDYRNKTLVYNLGCNGVGIMPSIFGAEKVSKIIKGDKFDKSIFDVRTL